MRGPSGTARWVGVLRLVRLQRTPQGLNSSRPFAFRQQRRNGLHQPHPAEELTLRDVMNDRPLPVRLKEVLRPGLHQVGTEPPQCLPESDPRRRLEVGHLTLEGAHPRRIEVRRPLAREDRQKFGRTVGTNPCGASRFRSPPGPPTARTRPRWVGRSSCATRTGRCYQPPSSCAHCRRSRYLLAGPRVIVACRCAQGVREFLPDPAVGN